VASMRRPSSSGFDPLPGASDMQRIYQFGGRRAENEAYDSGLMALGGSSLPGHEHEP
jgi:hypothetical protein